MGRVWKEERAKEDLIMKNRRYKKVAWSKFKKNYYPNTLGAFTRDPDAQSASDLFPTKDEKKKKEPEIKKGIAARKEI